MVPRVRSWTMEKYLNKSDTDTPAMTQQFPNITNQKPGFILWYKAKIEGEIQILKGWTNVEFHPKFWYFQTRLGLTISNKAFILFY